MLARALISAWVVWALLSPNAMNAFGKITQSQIISGCMELESAMTGNIYAIGKKDGQTWNISAKWENGYPVEIKFHDPQSDL